MKTKTSCIPKTLIIFTVLISAMLLSCSESSNTLHTIGGIPMPPAPGSAGKVTLEGIDSDNDGIRDDVQIAIHKRYPNDKGKRSALKQSFTDLEIALIAGETKDTKKILEAQKSSDKATQCRIKMFPQGNQSYEELLRMEALVVNTSERNEAYMNYNQGLSGKVLPAVTLHGNPCEN